MEGLAFVFINFIQASGFGHVGWGFVLDENQERFYFGSTDHLVKDPWWDLIGWIKYTHVDANGHNDWWSEIGERERMMHVMSRGHHIRYHAAKLIKVPQSCPDRAFATAEGMRAAGWSLLVNNCVHQTHSVLSDYGASLPPPSSPLTNLIPKRWFETIDGEYIDLTLKAKS